MIGDLNIDEINAAYELCNAGTPRPNVITGTCHECGADLYMDITGQIDICEHFRKAVDDACA